jgi:hypothetical protein
VSGILAVLKTFGKYEDLAEKHLKTANCLPVNPVYRLTAYYQQTEFQNQPFAFSTVKST